MSTKVEKLVIVESPAKAKTIEKYLGKEYTVKASVGHIRDLPKSNKKAIDIPAGFVPRYENLALKEKVISELKSLANKATEVYLATDPDREGEAIAWHVSEALGLKNPKRVTFHEITERAVTEAVAHPRAIDQQLVRAQEARRVLDRLVGYDLSGLIWKKVRYGLSAGRVQSPALRIIMEKEREIRAFVPEAFWVIGALLKHGKDDILFSCEEEPKTAEGAKKIVDAGNKGDWKIIGVKETEVKRSPKPPFTTSTLQQVASTRLGYSPSRTMGVAQKLYESGHITYMRTDSTNISKEVIPEIAHVIKDEFGENNVELRVYATKSKNAQEAHEAVRPSKMHVSRAGNTDDQRALYKLIRERTLASQMSDARLSRTKITANASDAKETEVIPNFSVTGSRVIFPGWLAADPDARGEDVTVPKCAEGDELSLIEMKAEEKSTEPPGRYTEAGLVKELEKRGIGRPSTYASIIKTLEDRGYVAKQGRTLFPTDTGDVVSSFLEEHFANYIGDTFTAEMEESLDDIADGKKQYEKVLKNFYTPFSKDVKSKDKIAKITNMGEAPLGMMCPVCGESMIIKLGRTGKFLSCKKFPDCKGARTIEGKELQGPKEIGEKCPECGEKKGGQLVEREGRFGMFVACSLYPKCKYVKKDQMANSTGVKCLLCKTGELAERRGRFGTFYSCTNYPDCRFAMKAKPTGDLCKDCQSLMMEGTKTIPTRCSNKACLQHNPHKIAK